MIERTVVPWRCHICGAEFNELRGGLCEDCDRPTCAACWGDQRAFVLSPQRTRCCKSCATLKRED